MKNIIKDLLREGLLKENAIGRHLIVVQPEYAQWMNGIEKGLFEYINTHIHELNNLTFLYNGEDTMGMVSEHEYRDWLVNKGLDEDIAYNVKMYDKGYAFFRYCMDFNIPHETIVNLIKFMVHNNINDSREINAKFWKQFVKEYKDDDYGTGEIRDLLEAASDCINIPDLMKFLTPYNNVVLVGGGVNECLREVELAMDALGKHYETWNRFTY